MLYRKNTRAPWFQYKITKVLTLWEFLTGFFRKEDGSKNFRAAAAFITHYHGFHFLRPKIVGNYMPSTIWSDLSKDEQMDTLVRQVEIDKSESPSIFPYAYAKIP